MTLLPAVINPLGWDPEYYAAVRRVVGAWGQELRARLAAMEAADAVGQPRRGNVWPTLRIPNKIEHFPQSQKIARVNAPGAGRPGVKITAEEIMEHRKTGKTHAQIAALAGIGHSTVAKILARAGIVGKRTRRVYRKEAL